MSSSELPRPISPDDALPPVEPPTAGFIIRLFVVPALIVSGLFVGWLLLQWLVQRGADPMEYVKALRRDNEARWQAAVSLADALRDVKDPRNAALRNNAAIARELADILDQQLTEARTDKKAVELRVYLCNALGEFQVDDGVSVLLQAVRQHKTEADDAVQFSALKALAVHVYAVANFDKAKHSEVLKTLLESSHHDEPLMRSTAAYGLGAWGGDEAQGRVEQMLGDGVADVRYNAATTLARHGRAAAVPTLVEMLDPARQQGLDAEKAEFRHDKRLKIEVSALQAVGKLIAANPDADLRPLEGAIDKLLDEDRLPVGSESKSTDQSTKLPEKLRLEALDVQRELARRSAKP